MPSLPSGSSLLILGMNHNPAPVEVREQLALSADEIRGVIQMENGAEILETSAVLSTCNRTEVYAIARTEEATPDPLLALLSGLRPDVSRVPPSHWYLHRNRAAVRHLFRVAGGLDSMMIGEPQILGQLKDAYQLYCDDGRQHPVFHKLFHLAFRCGKRVRSETALGAGEVSVASAAVNLALKIFSSLDQKSALLLGAGDTGELVARYLVDRNVLRLRIANRTASRADALAARLGGETVPFETWSEALARSDVVLFCTESPKYLLTADMMGEVMDRRDNRILFCIDLSVPRNCDPACGEWENVFLYNVDDLRQLADLNLGKRREEIKRAETIVDEVVNEYLEWQRSLHVDAVIAGIMKKAEAIRSREVDKQRKRFEEEHWKDLELLTRGIVRKVLADPLTHLKGLNCEGEGEVMRLDAVRDLFRLEDEREEERDA